MKSKNSTRFFYFVICLALLSAITSKAQTLPKIGAYYFDGWSANSTSVTSLMKTSFSYRQPKWGWDTSTQEAIDEQINLAADAGLSFFSFCWYSHYKNQDDPLNNALNLYLKSPNRSKLQFCLLVANIGNWHIGTSYWDTLTNKWIILFKQKKYLTVDSKPLVTFLSLSYLLQRFGSSDSLKNALSAFRRKVSANGFNGVSIAVCIGLNNKKEIEQAKALGFDDLTGYHNRTSGFVPNKTRVPIDSLISGEKRAWKTLSSLSTLPYIPVCTLNWDPRPWGNSTNTLGTGPYYVGVSKSSVQKSVSSVINWLDNNSVNTTKEKIAVIYAWNEYGEGGWLTPSKNDTLHLLEGVKNAIQNIPRK